MITFETDKLTKMIDRGLDFFMNKPRYLCLVTSRVIQYQELENVFSVLYLMKSIDDNTGEQLKRIGNLVGEPYSGQSTTNYRLAIKGRILRNKANARVNEILKLFIGYHIISRKNHFTLRSVVGQTEVDARAANAVLQVIKGAGIGADYLYNSYNGDNRFKMDSTVSGRATYFYKDYPNLMIDGNCDYSDLLHWNTTYGTQSKDATIVHTTGGKSLKVVAASTDMESYNNYTLENGKKYYYKFWFRINQNLSHVDIRNGSIILQRKTVPVDTWSKIQGTLVADTSLLKIYVKVSNATGVNYYLDDCEIKELN